MQALQQQYMELQRELARTRAQLQGAGRNKKRGELTLSELNDMPAETKSYLGFGEL
jgi:hypothetical protein